MTKKEHVDKALTEGLKEIVDLIKSSKKLAKNELPAVVKEILLTGKLKLALNAVIAVKLMLGCVLMFWLFPFDYSRNFTHGLMAFGSGVAGVMGIITWTSCWFDAIDLFFAPKTYILNKIKHLIS